MKKSCQVPFPSTQETFSSLKSVNTILSAFIRAANSKLLNSGVFAELKLNLNSEKAKILELELELDVEKSLWSF